MLRTALTVGALLLIPASAYAQTAVGIGQASSNSASQAISGSSSGVTINNPGNIVSQGFNRVRQSGSLRTTADAYAPGLAASAVNTCLGSSSLGFGITGFGFSGGTTHPDMPCNLRMYSAALLATGNKGAAAAVLCHDPHVYNAFAAVGVQCPLMPHGYASVNHRGTSTPGSVPLPPPAPRATYIPVNGTGHARSGRESYEHQEARAAASRLQDEYRRNGALR